MKLQSLKIILWSFQQNLQVIGGMSISKLTSLFKCHNYFAIFLQSLTRFESEITHTQLALFFNMQWYELARMIWLQNHFLWSNVTAVVCYKVLICYDLKNMRAIYARNLNTTHNQNSELSLQLIFLSVYYVYNTSLSGTV